MILSPGNFLGISKPTLPISAAKESSIFSSAVIDLSLEELRELDAGYRFTDLDGDHSFRGRGVRIPTFEEVLDACPHVWINAEAKEAAGKAPRIDTEIVLKTIPQLSILVCRARHDRVPMLNAVEALLYGPELVA